jgi:anti-sigma regulatory factor (Ser/Thr protein kinase)
MREAIHIDNDLDELDRVHDGIVRFLDGIGADSELAEEMFLVAEEVLANTISYGYRDDDVHRIELELSFSDGCFGMRFRDDGVEFDPLSRADPDLDAPTEERGIGGLGIHLVKTLTDEASWRRDGDANILTLRKRVS